MVITVLEYEPIISFISYVVFVFLLCPEPNIGPIANHGPSFNIFVE